jgi:hypothetical protein
MSIQRAQAGLQPYSKKIPGPAVEWTLFESLSVLVIIQFLALGGALLLTRELILNKQCQAYYL